MKKIMSLIFVAIISLGIGVTSVAAAGAISADEQAILNELNAGVTAGGGTFYFDTTQIAEAELHLKANDVSAADSATIVGHIQAARQLVVDNAAGITATSLKNLISQLPKAVQNEILGHIEAVQALLGLAGGSNGVTDKAGNPVITKGAPIVKATGANYITSLVAFASLMIVALGAAVVGKKYANA